MSVCVRFKVRIMVINTQSLPIVSMWLYFAMDQTWHFHGHKFINEKLQNREESCTGSFTPINCNIIVQFFRSEASCTRFFPIFVFFREWIYVHENVTSGPSHWGVAFCFSCVLLCKQQGIITFIWMYLSLSMPTWLRYVLLNKIMDSW